MLQFKMKDFSMKQGFMLVLLVANQSVVVSSETNIDPLRSRLNSFTEQLALFMEEKMDEEREASSNRRNRFCSLWKEAEALDKEAEALDHERQKQLMLHELLTHGECSPDSCYEDENMGGFYKSCKDLIGLSSEQLSRQGLSYSEQESPMSEKELPVWVVDCTPDVQRSFHQEARDKIFNIGLRGEIDPAGVVSMLSVQSSDSDNDETFSEVPNNTPRGKSNFASLARLLSRKGACDNNEKFSKTPHDRSKEEIDIERLTQELLMLGNDETFSKVPNNTPCLSGSSSSEKELPVWVENFTPDVQGSFLQEALDKIFNTGLRDELDPEEVRSMLPVQSSDSDNDETFSEVPNNTPRGKSNFASLARLLSAKSAYDNNEKVSKTSHNASR